MAQYREDPSHPALLNKNGKPNPTKQPRFGNRLYCLVWADHDLLKLGLGSGAGNARSGSAIEALRKYLAFEGAKPGPVSEWRAELPFMEGATWGDCQRLELVVATALKRRLGATSAPAVGFEWLTRTGLDAVDWPVELAAALSEALEFAGLQGEVHWKQRVPTHAAQPVAGALGAGGQSQRGAHRTRRNRRGMCALKGCEEPLPATPVKNGRFDYCSSAHADQDAADAMPAGPTDQANVIVPGGPISKTDTTMITPVAERDAAMSDFISSVHFVDSNNDPLPAPAELPTLTDPEFDDWDD